MTPFLSDAWFELLVDGSRACPNVEGASAEVLIAVDGGHSGRASARLTVVDGRIVETVPRPDVDADLELGCPFDLALAMLKGETSPAVEFMRGRLKASGDMAALHRILPLTSEPGFGQLLDRVIARTEF